MFACPHFLSFFCVVSALEQNVSYGLRSVAALALVGVRFVDAVEIRPEADLAVTHLCDHRADRSMYATMRFECRFPWFDAKLEELSSVLGRFPRSFPLGPHSFADKSLRCCHEDLEGVWLWRIWVRLGSLLGGFIGRFIPRNANMCWNPPELDVPSLGPEFVEDLDSLRQDILTRGLFGVPYSLDGGLVVSEDGAPPGRDANCVYVEYDL